MASLHIDGTIYPLETGKLYLVGRRRSDDATSRQPEICLDCATVEAKHALLDVGSDVVHLVDMKSDSGTYVNGARAAFTKLSLSSECTQLRFGSVEGKLLISKSSYLIPQTAKKAPERRSDSFIIPETQAPINDSLMAKNDEISLNNDHFTNEADISDDDFCIPETQEVVTARFERHVPPGRDLSQIGEHSKDNELDGGTMIRMCTQDFNETNEDSRDTTDSDLLLASLVIPHIRHSPIKPVDQEPALNEDSDAEQPGSPVAANSKSASATSPNRSGDVTPDIFELAGLPNEKETSKLLEERLAAGTPDLFDTNENNNTIKSSESRSKPPEASNDCLNASKPGNVKEKTVNKTKSMTAAPQPVEDEFDLMETQPFSVYQQNNPSEAARLNLIEERSCTPDLFDFAAPLPVAKPANMSNTMMNENASFTCNADVHAVPKKTAQIADAESEDEDDDDLLPTQPYSVFLKSMNKDKATSNSQLAQKPNEAFASDGSNSKPAKSFSLALPKSKTQTVDKVGISSAPKNDNQAAAMLPPGDEYDLMPTQPFSACHTQMNSTLIGGTAGKKPQNATSFFEAVESTPQKKVTAAKPFKVPDATPMLSSLSGSSRCSQNSTEMFCTPQGINAICGQSEKETQPEGKPKPLNKRIFSDEEDDDDDPGTFDMLLKRKMSLPSAKESKDESIKHHQFKLAFNTTTPVALARKREDRALKRQIKNLITDEPPKKQARDKVLSKITTIGSDPERIEIKKKSQSALKQMEERKSINKIVAATKSGKNEKRELDPTKLDKTKTDAKDSTGEERLLEVKAVDSRKSIEIIKVQKKIERGTSNTAEPTKPDANEPKKRESKGRTSVEQPKLVSGKELRQRISKSPVSKAIQKKTTERNLRSHANSPTKRAAKPDEETRATESGTVPKTRRKIERDKTQAEESEPNKHERATRSRRAKTPLVEVGQESAVEATPPVEPVKRHIMPELQIKLKSMKMPEKEQKPKVKEQESRPTRRVTRLKSHLNDNDGAKGVLAEKPKELSSKSKPVTRNKSAAKETIKRSDSVTSAVYSNNSSEEQPTPSLSESSSAEVAKYSGNELTEALNSKRTTRQRAGTKLKNTDIPKNAEPTGAQHSSRSKHKHITADNAITDGSKPSTPSKKMKFATSMVDQSLLNAILPDVAEFVTYTTDPLDFDVLLMEKPSRTFKFLVAMASGKPIVRLSWLENVLTNRSTHTRSFEYFFIKDDFEKKYSFNFMASLKFARSKKLFEGLHFMATANVRPTVPELKVITKCAGGTFHTAAKSDASKTFYLISNQQDMRHWHQYRRKYAHLRIVDVEGFILAVLRQSLQPLDDYVIS